jgi:hypothetical protein
MYDDYVPLMYAIPFRLVLDHRITCKHRGDEHDVSPLYKAVDVQPPSRSYCSQLGAV